MIWYNVRLTYLKENSKGNQVKVNEVYLVDSILFGEAETKAYDMASDNSLHDFNISRIQQEELANVLFFTDGEIWFRVTIVWEDVDGKKNREKVILNANNLEEAIKRADLDYASNGMNYVVTKAEVTKIVQVYRRKEHEEI